MDTTYLAAVAAEMKQYGVKGMRWGVRKSRSGGSGGRIPKAARKTPDKMSDQELKKVIARMQLEQQYRQLTATAPSARQKLKAEVGKIAAQQARNIGSRAATIAVAKAFGFAAGKTTNPALAEVFKQMSGVKEKKDKKD